MSLSELILELKEGQVAKALFGNESWYVIRSFGFIRYFEGGSIAYARAFSLTYSNLNAKYYIE